MIICIIQVFLHRTLLENNDSSAIDTARVIVVYCSLSADEGSSSQQRCPLFVVLLGAVMKRYTPGLMLTTGLITIVSLQQV